MKVWAKSLKNIQYGKILPTEDSFSYHNNVFCVADGVTRDPIGIPDFTNIDPLEALKNYPNPSPAATAAQICANTFVGQLDNHPGINVRDGLVAANERIAELNEGITCDYLENDFASCVAVGGKIIGDSLYWASIGDCRAAVFSKNGERRFITPDGTQNWIEYEQTLKNRWGKPDYRVMVRRDFRNQPTKMSNGKPVGFGVLTGEKKAESFIMSGEEKLLSGDTVVFFTDGFGPQADLSEFGQKVSNENDFLDWQKLLAEQDPDKLGKERTIIVVEFEF